MKSCPVCNTKVEALYTGLCSNPDCTWEFEFIGAEPTPEMKSRYDEKLKRAILAYTRFQQQHIEVPSPHKEKNKTKDVILTSVQDPITKKCGYINEKGIEVIDIIYDSITVPLKSKRVL